MIPPELLAAYERTVVDLELPGGALRLPSIGSGERAARWPFTRPVYVLTAWNPWSLPLQPAENASRQERLRRVLAAAQLHAFRAWGRAEAGGWEEESLALPWTSEAAALALARTFGQQAIYGVVEGRLQVRDASAGG
jgi:hypothetical protein